MKRLLILLFTMIPLITFGEEVLKDLYFQSVPVDYAADKVSLNTAEAVGLFTQILQGDRSQGLREAWRKIGFEMLSVSSNNRNYTVIKERDEDRIGRGFYVFSDNAKSSLPSSQVLQAPHRFKDRETGLITFELFTEGNFCAAAWNTAKEKDANVVYQDNTYFMSFTKAIVAAGTVRQVLQIHGFSNANHVNDTVHNADIVLSSGDGKNTAFLKPFVDCFHDMGKIKIFGEDAQNLGATKNKIGQFLRSSGSVQFVHIELNLKMRMELLKDSKIRKLFLKCLEKLNQ